MSLHIPEGNKGIGGYYHADMDQVYQGYIAISNGLRDSLSTDSNFLDNLESLQSLDLESELIKK